MSNSWQSHPNLQGKFHPQFPDDIQVIVHDGGPRLTSHRPEAVWVRVVSGDGDIFTAQVFNAPAQLDSVRQGDQIQFIAISNSNYKGPPLMVRPKYLQERGKWQIEPCNKCGLNELFDAPSDLIAKIFPNSPGVPVMFTSFCGACGGVQGIAHKSADFPDDDTPIEFERQPKPAEKKWWQFWK